MGVTSHKYDNPLPPSTQPQKGRYTIDKCVGTVASSQAKSPINDYEYIPSAALQIDLSSAEEVTFLNTRVYLRVGLIGTDLHVKPTDIYGISEWIVANHGTHSLSDMTAMVIDLVSSQGKICSYTTDGHIPSCSTTAQSKQQAVSAHPSCFRRTEAGLPITTFNCLLTFKELEGSPGQSNINHHPTRCTRKLSLWIRKMQDLSNTSDHEYVR